jgi:hypothetical protein
MIKEEMQKPDGASCPVCRADFEWRVTKAPNTLIMALKRYRQDGRAKNTTSVYIQSDIELEEWGDGEKVRYNLSSIVRHHGDSQRQGHYTAMVRHEGDWWKADDSKITKMASFAVVAEESARDCYILMFEKHGTMANGSAAVSTAAVDFVNRERKRFDDGKALWNSLGEFTRSTWESGRTQREELCDILATRNVSQNSRLS